VSEQTPSEQVAAILSGEWDPQRDDYVTDEANLLARIDNKLYAIALLLQHPVASVPPGPCPSRISLLAFRTMPARFMPCQLRAGHAGLHEYSGELGDMTWTDADGSES
jgi:hypothetical protein